MDSKTAKKKKKKKLTIKADKLPSSLAELSQQADDVEKRLLQARHEGVPVLSLHYEDIKKNLDYARYFALYGSACHEPHDKLIRTPVFKKMHSGGLQNLIGNWEEVVSVLGATEWAWMLND